jgi:hypothetical protein
MTAGLGRGAGVDGRQGPTRKRFVVFAFCALSTIAAVSFLLGAGAASSAPSSDPGALDCPTLPNYNNTHYGLKIGHTVTCTIDGAADVSGNSTVTIYIKHGSAGNETVTGSVSGTGAGTTVTFTYTAPADLGCNTAIVAYSAPGNGATNDIIDDGVKNGSAAAAAGFGYLDANGLPITCGGTPPPVDLTVSKTATPSFKHTYHWGITKKVDATRANIANGGSATFNYTVSVTHDAGTDGSWQVTGSITVSNPNAFNVTGVNITDAIDDGGACSVANGTNVTVPASGSAVVGYTCTYASAPSPAAFTNTATATWPNIGSPHTSATGTATGDFAGVSPAIVDGSVTVTDTLGGALGTLSYTDPSPTTFSYSKTFSGVGGTCTSYDNTATFTTNTTSTTGSDSQSVEVCVGKNLTVDKDTAPSFKRTYHWAITKNVDATRANIADGGSATFNYTVNVTHDGGVDSGWKVSGTITVNNPNDWEAVTLTAVTDAIDNSGNCSITSGNPHASVPAGGSVTLGYTCTYASAPSPTAFTNTATATWDGTAAFTPAGSASGTASGDFAGVSPTIVDGSVTVTDTLEGALGTVSYTDPSPVTFSYSKTFSGVGGTCTSYDNTATFTTNTSDTTGSASQSVRVCVGKNLTVGKDATPSYSRAYLWQIAKNVDKTSVKLSGGTATFNYTVTASETGFTDSGWLVSGSITVSNPNDWEAVTLTGVSDLIDNGGSCSITSGNPQATIPASGSVTLGYVCTYAAAPNPAAFTNTATATWDGAASFTPDGSASGTAAGSFGDPTSTSHATITVTDSYAGTLGTLTATSSPPFASQTFTYSRTIPVPLLGCLSYPNTARIVETGQSASQTVQVCGPSPIGGLTIGFWQNKNGQGIISSGASIGGVCTSGAWLRVYAPFQDLSITATCSQVASYVTGVIKAANASGASMNAMLKAQMLATALDVYFSTPGLGGNKIGAPSPIGSDVIDLTNVPPDGNVSAAFGGATSMSVSALLSYAASQSNAGGSLWYGNGKAMQGLAKDTFDAINNGTIGSI